MIESTKFKKMLSILKTDSKDLNIDISIVDYDTSKECDYETLTLHLKETNTQNGAYVYKDFIIRSQLYYDESDDKYYSALDGDIIVKGDKPTKLTILTDINNSTFANEDVSLKVKLIDSETQEPLKNQSVYMYLSSSPEESILSATTNKTGEATFNFYLPSLNILTGEYILHFEYIGNKTYRKSKSDYVLINLEDTKNKDINSNITAYIDVDEHIILTYNMLFNNTNLVDGFNEYTSAIESSNTDFNINETDLLKGQVLFYAKQGNNSVFLGGNYLINTLSKTYSFIRVPFPKNYYNQDIEIEAVFEGNNYFSPNSATTQVRLDRMTPTNINLEVVDTNEDPINTINNDGFCTKVSFDIDFSLPDGSDIYEDGLDTFYQLFGEVTFYLQNANEEWGTLSNNLPFYIANELMHMDGTNTISTETDFVLINLDNYGLSVGDPLYIKAEYSGNAVVNSFTIDNKSRQTRNSQR